MKAPNDPRAARNESGRAGDAARGGDDRPILVHGPWSARYDLGPAHPLTPRRFGPGIDLVRRVSERAGAGPIREIAPQPASDEELRLVHAAAYLAVVRRLSEDPLGIPEAGIGPGDTPAFAGMHEAAAAVAGGSIRAMEAVLRGEASHAFHPGGGLHHAMPDRASGFCVYDDPAIAIARARRAGFRVLYVDLDVHHGDGVQAIHADDPGVLTLSIHQSGRTLFPGTGFVAELGEGRAAGTALNLPMEPGTGERAWLAALQAVLPEAAAAFGPDVIVSQHGADAHAWDPLANLRVTTTAMGAAARLVDAITHRWAGGRWLATGGGGYAVYRVVPRAWSLVWLAASHVEIAPAVPAAWRERWTADALRHGEAPLPERLEDEPNAGLRPDAAQDRADRQAAGTAALLRELAVPALVRAAGDLGWWRALDDLGPGPDGRTPVPASAWNGLHPARLRGGADSVDRADPATAPTILDTVDAGAWERLELAARAVPPADAPTAHRLVLAALRSRHGVHVTAAVHGSTVVGAAVSVASDGVRRLLCIGVAPEHRRRGLAGALVRRHVASANLPGVPWEAVVTVAERDPVDPLARRTRAVIARRLLEDAGFQVDRATGPTGASDRAAIVGRRG